MKDNNVNVKNNEIIMLSPKYLILTEKTFTKDEIKDLRNLRFIANNKKWDCL